MKTTKRILALLLALGLCLSTAGAARAAESEGRSDERVRVLEQDADSEPEEAERTEPEDPEPFEAEEQSLTPQQGEEDELVADSYFTPEVQLLEGKDHGAENYSALSSALGRADGTHRLRVRVQTPGVYHVASGGGALMLRSETELDLNGSTLLRSGGMKNLMQNESLDGKRSVAGYTATRNVTVKNGTLDGGGNAMPNLNLVNLGHAEGLRFEKVSFLHGQGTHLLELNGCQNCTITGCTFDGYERCGSKSLPEAIQLDIAYNGAGDSWNGVYCEKGTPGCDNTVCQNILVENCQFKDYPAGVGNHHCLYRGPRSRKIVIRNNRFTNRVKWGKINDFEPPAVWCYGLEDSEVSGNTITGVYQCGVRFSGGSVTVKGNKIGTKKKPVSYPPIYVTEANSYVKGKGKTRKAESVTGGRVDGNTIYTTYSKSKNGAISVHGKSRLSSIGGNKLFSGVGSGICVSSKSTVGSVNSNIVTGAGQSGIYISQSTVRNVNGNKVSRAKKNGIEVTSSGTVAKVQKNTVSGCKGTGIVIKNKKLTVSVLKNRLTGNKTALKVSAKGKIQKK